jgi:hypothetical protein
MFSHSTRGANCFLYRNSPAATSTLSLGSSFCDVYASEVLYAAVMQFDDGCDVLKSVRKTLKRFIRETVTFLHDNMGDQFPLLRTHGSVNDQTNAAAVLETYVLDTLHQTGSPVMNFMKNMHHSHSHSH